MQKKFSVFEKKNNNKLKQKRYKLKTKNEIIKEIKTKRTEKRKINKK